MTALLANLLTLHYDLGLNEFMRFILALIRSSSNQPNH